MSNLDASPRQLYDKYLYIKQVKSVDKITQPKRHKQGSRVSMWRKE